MKYAKQEKLALFIANAQTIKKGFTWQGPLVKRLAALLYALDNKPMDCDAVRECHGLIKGSTGVFSTFRGNMSLCVAAMLSLRNNREELLGNTLSVYEMMKTAKFRASDYLVVAAYQIAANAPKEQFGQAVERARAFYDAMKARRWFHTGQDDTIFAAMLGLSDLDPNEGADRVEQLFQQMKREFWSGNSVQALSQILVLSGKCEEVVQHILELRDTLRSKKVRLDKTYTLPALGVLALLPVDGDVLAGDILEAQEYIRAQKGFGAFSVTSQELLLYAAAVISSSYAEDADNGITAASVSTSIASIIIAQQAAMIAAFAASSAAASAAASS
jgi:hypothetical protein